MPHTLDPGTAFERLCEGLGFDAWRVRARLIRAVSSSVVLIALCGGIAYAMMRSGPAVNIVSDLSDKSGNVLINNLRPVILPVRVLDRRGHALDPHHVRYRWIAGTVMDVGPNGTFRCKDRADAVVRATVGNLSKDFTIRCRPVAGIRAPSWLDLVAGGEARQLPFEGVGLDGEPVSYLRGKIAVRDTSIANVTGLYVRPVAVGETTVDFAFGDNHATIKVLVNELVSSFAHLRPDQLFVGRQVRLARGDTVRWPLPIGTFWLKYVAARDGEAPPSIDLQGAAHCQRANPLQTVILTEDVVATLCTADGPADVRVAHGNIGVPLIEGFILLDRTRGPFSTSAKH